MNRELNLSFGMIKGSKFVELKDIEHIHSMRDAIAHCIQIRQPKYTMNELAALLDIDRGHWSKIQKKTAHFPVDKLTELMRLCGNYVPLQYFLTECGFDSKVVEMLEKLAA